MNLYLIFYIIIFFNFWWRENAGHQTHSPLQQMEKEQKRRGGKILRHFPQNSWHFPTRNCSTTCLGAEKLICLSSKNKKGRRKFCYQENNIMTIISINMIWRDHVFNYGQKLATMVTKFLRVTIFFSKFCHTRSPFGGHN